MCCDILLVNLPYNSFRSIYGGYQDVKKYRLEEAWLPIQGPHKTIFGCYIGWNQALIKGQR